MNKELLVSAILMGIFPMASYGQEKVAVNLPQKGVFAVDSAKLSYMVEGEGTTLVVLPGGPGLGFGYLHRELTELLADSYRLLFLDQRGCGHSTGIEDTTRLTMATFVEDLEQVREAAGLAQLNLLGHSFGGLQALYYAVTYPDRVASLILVESDPASWELWRSFQTIVESRRTEENRSELAEITQQERWAEQPEVMETFFHTFLRPYFGNLRVADRLRLRLDETVLRNYNTTYQRMRRDLGQWELHSELAKIICPTLVLYGELSIFAPQAGKELEAQIQDAKLVRIAGAGHFPYLEAPEAFEAEIKSFFLENRLR